MRERALRLLAESLVIFFSVVLALIADDWRTARDDRAAEREYLASIVNDLELDSRALSMLDDQLGEQVAANVALLRFVEHGAGEDSVLSVIDDAMSVFNYRPSYPTYQSLVGGGDLKLVGDVDLREQLTVYHEDWAAYLNTLLDGVSNRADEVSRLLRPYVRRREVTAGVWQIVHVDSLDDLAQQVAVLNAIADCAALRSFLRRRVQELFLAENARLREAIEAYLNSVR